MRLLLDSCLSPRARDFLRAAGHDVDWAGDWPRDPGDAEILARAHAEGRVLVTLDKDFGELAVVRGAPHAGIFRVVAQSSRSQGELIARVLETHGPDLAAGAIVTLQGDRLRIRTTGA